jgi:thioredoxin 1
MFSSPVLRRALVTGIAASAALYMVATSPLVAQPAASAKTPFTTEAFTKAQGAGKPILVEISADWCPTCKAQRPILQNLTSAAPLNGLTVFEVNFDTQKDVLRLLRADRQSTLIAFKGKTETGRSVGDTYPESIRTLLQSAL